MNLIPSISNHLMPPFRIVFMRNKLPSCHTNIILSLFNNMGNKISATFNLEDISPSPQNFTPLVSVSKTARMAPIWWTWEAHQESATSSKCCAFPEHHLFDKVMVMIRRAVMWSWNGVVEVFGLAKLDCSIETFNSEPGSLKRSRCRKLGQN